MTAKTAEASTIHEPLGKPGGPGLFHHKGLQLPAYVQHVAHHLISQGHDRSKAIEMAIGIVKNWAAGHDGHGNKVHPDVQAAAGKAVAEWEKAKASGGSKRMTVTERATKAPYGDVPYGDPGYLDADGNQASKSGKPGVKRYPLSPDKVMAAWSYINQEKNAGQYTAEQLSAIKGRIKAAMKRHGHDVAEDTSSSASREDGAPAQFMRSYPLEDISIRAGGDGRTVDAYAAVFETPVPIHDPDGDYIEVIDPGAFSRILPKLAPQGERKAWRCGVFYNHGLTIHGSPSDRHSMPIGVPLEIRADHRGLFTRTRYHRGELADMVLEAISEGSLAGYSFSGRFDRSNPARPPGGWHPDRYGKLPVVRRTESTLREYGPTPFPAYPDAGITAVRADLVTEQLDEVSEALRSGLPLDSLIAELPAAPDRGSVAGDSRRVARSVRSVREDMIANRAAFLLRHRR